MQKKAWNAYLIWAVGALFFLYQYFVRVIPSVIEDSLEANFSATTTQIASSISLYLIVYAAMQLFVGPLFDTYGARKLFLRAGLILTFSCLLPIFPGKMLFWFGSARVLMGFASAFSFVGVLYLCALWFPKEQLAMLSGLTAGMGILGAVTAQMSLSYFATHGWNVWIIAFLFGCIVTSFLFIFIPKHSPGEILYPEINVLHQCKSYLCTIGRQWSTWNIGLIATAIYTPSAVFADLWSIPYFTQVCHFSLLEASQLASVLNLMRAVSAPLLGWISDSKRSRKVPLVINGFIIALAFSLLLTYPHLSFWPTAGLLSIIGFCSGGEIIGFVACAEQNSPRMRASSIAFINMIIMGLCGLIQAFIGFIINTCERYLSVTVSYQFGLGFLVIFILFTTSIFSFYFKIARVSKENSKPFPYCTR